MKSVYYIGGSPCSGKSTIAEYLEKKYNLYYFKADDSLEKYTIKGAEKKLQICVKQRKMNAEETWMRNPVLQCEEELQFYNEIFPFIWQDLMGIQTDTAIIAEGAAFLPEFMQANAVSKKNYLSITPSREFQLDHYRQREWVHYVLDGCNDPEKAFDNWMERDCCFANEVHISCNKLGYRSIINDGELPVEEFVKIVSEHFGLEQ